MERIKDVPGEVPVLTLRMRPRQTEGTIQSFAKPEAHALLYRLCVQLGCCTVSQELMFRSLFGHFSWILYDMCCEIFNSTVSSGGDSFRIPLGDSGEVT